MPKEETGKFSDLIENINPFKKAYREYIHKVYINGLGGGGSDSVIFG